MFAEDRFKYMNFINNNRLLWLKNTFQNIKGKKQDKRQEINQKINQ